MTIINPLSAPAPEPRKFIGPKRLIENTIEDDAPIALKQAWGFPLEQNVPYWKIKYEDLDCAWPDGPHYTEWGTIFHGPDGRPLDNTQPYAIIAQAFAGLDIIIFPGDPRYDESAVVGNCFEVESVDFRKSKKSGKTIRYPLPVRVLGPDYQFDGTVRILTPRNSDESVAVTPGGAPVSVDLAQDPAALQRLRTALAGVDTTDEDAVLDALRSSNIKGATLNGTSVLSLALKGQLGTELEALA